MNVEKINDYLNEKGVVIIPGFQVFQKAQILNNRKRRFDATAVAVAKLLTGHLRDIY